MVNNKNIKYKRKKLNKLPLIYVLHTFQEVGEAVIKIEAEGSLDL